MKAPSYTWAGGVIGPGLYGRVDLNKYQTGLKSAENFNIAVEGGAEKRFGLYLVGETKFPDKEAKLISWRISNDDSYILEFGDLYIRFIRFGGYVGIPGGHVPHVDSDAIDVGGFMEIVTPYTEAEVAELKYTFANDIMYIFHPNHEPRQLRRLGLYDWDFIPIDFSPHPAFSGVVTATYTDDTTTDDNYDAEPVPTEYKVSATLSNGLETLPSAVVSVDADLGHRRTKVDLSWPAQTDAIQYTVYKGKSGIFGFIGYTEGTSFTDRNFAPSYEVVPLGTELDFGASYPRVGEFWKQRMGFAASLDEAQALWFSRPLIFNSLRTSVPNQADDAIKVTLVGRKRHTINHMVELKKFLIFTDTAEWVINTIENKALSTATIDPVPETYYGSHPNLRPIPIGERILFIQNITGSILDMGYEFTSNAFKADDLSRLARFLFKGKVSVSWDYASFPGNLLHCVASDGTLNSMTYVREHEIWGWAWSKTEGKFLDVAVVTEATQDGAYFQVRRNVGGSERIFVERTEIPASDRIEDMFYVDCGLTYKDFLPFESFARVSPIEATVEVPGHSYSVGDELQLEFYLDEEFQSYLRFEITAIDGDTLTLSILRNAVIPLDFEFTSGESFLCVDTITGFSHLEGETIVALADAKVVRDLTVTGGEITLPFKAARVHAGIYYDAYLETLDLDVQEAAGTYSIRAVDTITLRVRNSRDIWAGATKSPRDLVKLSPRNSSTGYYEPNEPIDGAVEIPAHVGWDRTCGIRVESRSPLPLNVLNIVPDITYG